MLFLWLYGLKQNHTELFNLSEIEFGFNSVTTNVYLDILLRVPGIP